MKKCIKCCADLPDNAIYCLFCGKKQVQEKRKALKRANGTGTVYKLQGRRTRPWVAAKNKVIIGYYPRKTDALEALEHLTGRSLDERYNMTFAEVYEAWKAEHFRDISKNTIGAYSIAYRAFAPIYGKKFRELRTADLQEVIDAKRDVPESARKIKQLGILMYKWAIREEISTTNFAQFITIPQTVKSEKEIFTDEDIQKIEADGSEAAMIVMMLLSTGMRIGELFSLPISSYYGDYVVGGEKTEAGRNRVIPIRPEGQAAFAYFAERASGPLLISGYSGHHTLAKYRERDYYPLLNRLGIEKKTPHATRHTYASRAVKEGLPPEVLQRVLGHAKYSTTADIYTHLDAQTLIKAVTDSLLTNKESSKEKEAAET